MEKLVAKKGKFRIVGYDSFDHEDFLVGDYKTLAEAKTISNEKTNGVEMLLMHVYDDKGKHLYQCGKF